MSNLAKVYTSASLVGIDDTILRRAVSEELSSLPIADGDKLLASLEPVLLYLRDWLLVNPTVLEPDARSVFVFCDYPRIQGDRLGLTRIRLFQEELVRPIVGSLHLCGTGLADVMHGPLAVTTADSIASHLEASDLDSYPTLFFHPARHEAVFYPEGVRRESLRLAYSLAAPMGHVTWTEIEAILSDFHQHAIRVPNKVVVTWSNPYRFHPVKDVEQTIQGQLVLSLRLRVPPDCRIFPELDSGSGRADIGVFPASNTTDRIILELKVLRSYYCGGRSCSDAENQQALTDGVHQATEYRARVGATEAMLCCYDMRRSDDSSLMDCVQQLSCDKNVKVYRYYLYNSHRAAHRAN